MPECASGMGAQPTDGGRLCVGGGETGSLNVFNCFGQLSKSKLQQMEVELKIGDGVYFTA